MAHLSKKQPQERLMEEFLRRIREASPGGGSIWPLAICSRPPRLHDLNEVRRTARRAAETPAVAMRGRTAVEFWLETLRALKLAMSMTRLWRDQGKPQHRRELLAPIYGWFTEGFDTLDLKKAEALLAELYA
jgi:hypothetical protein